MANTTNFGWETPDDTDLVKDGAAAMRTLGNAIDASLVDLKGGTTGQVLSKNTNTDMDFTWVTTDDANAIQNAIVDAKGDLIAASAADTPARLAVGSNGDTLVADSSTTTGLRWNPVKSLVNPLINSAFDIFQRTSTPTTGMTTIAGFGYTLDRWISRTANAGGSMVTSRQVTNDTTNLPFIQYCARLRRSTGNSDTGQLQIQQAIETTNSIPFIGRQVTLSFYARKGSGFTGAFSATIYSGTVGDEALVVGFTGISTVAQTTPTLTTDWVRYTVTGTVSSTAKQIGVVFGHSPSGTAGSDDYYEVTGVQIDLGAVALPFARTGGTLAGELAACQRYYVRFGNSSFSTYGTGFGISSTVASFICPLPVEMRVVPTAVEFGNLATVDATTRTAITSLALAAYNAKTMGAVDATVASGLTQNRSYFIQNNNNTAGFLAFTAEL